MLTRNLKMKGILDKLKNHFMGPFKVQKRIGKLAYRLLIPKTWKAHLVFHISLLKRWNIANSQGEEDSPLEQLMDH